MYDLFTEYFGNTHSEPAIKWHIRFIHYSLREWQELGMHRAILQCMTPSQAVMMLGRITHACDLDFFDSFLGGARLGTQSGGVVSEQGESLD